MKGANLTGITIDTNILEEILSTVQTDETTIYLDGKPYISKESTIDLVCSGKGQEDSASYDGSPQKDNILIQEEIIPSVFVSPGFIAKTGRDAQLVVCFEGPAKNVLDQKCTNTFTNTGSGKAFKVEMYRKEISLNIRAAKTGKIVEEKKIILEAFSCNADQFETDEDDVFDGETLKVYRGLDTQIAVDGIIRDGNFNQKLVSWLENYSDSN
jgi:hypothetical protein